MKLASHRYGKARVRLLKVFRSDTTQDLREIDVQVLLRGEFENSYTSADNSSVVPTDTIKNTIQVLGERHLGLEIERFALVCAAHFLGKYSQVKSVTAEIQERAWERMEIGGHSHPHSFLPSNKGNPFVRVEARAGSSTVISGVRNLLILKTTGSGFSGFNQCDLTTLKETDDRIMSTVVDADWTWKADPGDYEKARREILALLLEVFAGRFSPSVQNTLYDGAAAVLEKIPSISEISIRMPNKHYLPLDLSRFGLENRNDLFLPTDEPHGQIEATISRD